MQLIPSVSVQKVAKSCLNDMTLFWKKNYLRDPRKKEKDLPSRVTNYIMG